MTDCRAGVCSGALRGGNHRHVSHADGHPSQHPDRRGCQPCRDHDRGRRARADHVRGQGLPACRVTHAPPAQRSEPGQRRAGPTRPGPAGPRRLRDRRRRRLPDRCAPHLVVEADHRRDRLAVRQHRAARGLDHELPQDQELRHRHVHEAQHGRDGQQPRLRLLPGQRPGPLGARGAEPDASLPDLLPLQPVHPRRGLRHQPAVRDPDLRRVRQPDAAPARALHRHRLDRRAVRRPDVAEPDRRDDHGRRRRGEGRRRRLPDRVVPARLQGGRRDSQDGLELLEGRRQQRPAQPGPADHAQRGGPDSGGLPRPAEPPGDRDRAAPPLRLVRRDGVERRPVPAGRRRLPSCRRGRHGRCTSTSTTRTATELGHDPAGSMEWDARHGHTHWHFRDFARYRLLDANKDHVVRSRKEAFCLANTDAVDYTPARRQLEPVQHRPAHVVRRLHVDGGSRGARRRQRRHLLPGSARASRSTSRTFRTARTTSRSRPTPSA